MAVADNVTISRGTGGEVYWPLFNEDGTPVADFTGWTARVQVRPYFGIELDDPETTENESNLLHEFAYRFEGNGIYITYTEAETAGWGFLRGCGDFKIWANGVPKASPHRFYLWVRQTATVS